MKRTGNILQTFARTAVSGATTQHTTDSRFTHLRNDFL